MTFTRRRKTGLGDSILRGLSAIGTAMADAPKKVRIDEIDILVRDLLQERDHLIADLIEPGDLTVSENYDPRWRKPAPKAADISDGEGRLTKCKGQWSASSTIHDCHPGCPYIGTKHIAHEFTLRD